MLLPEARGELQHFLHLARLQASNRNSVLSEFPPAGSRSSTLKRAMGQANFEKLVESVRQADRIIAGAEKASRVTEVPALRIKRARTKLALTQAQLAKLVHVELATIRNWEQGRRQPEGPALALLTALENDPEHVIAALNAGARLRAHRRLHKA